MRRDSVTDLRRFSWRMTAVFGAFSVGCYVLAFTASPGAINPAIAATVLTLVLAGLAWRTPSGEPSRTEAEPEQGGDGTKWRVQGFLLPQVTAKAEDVPYAPIIVDSNREAREVCTALYRSHAPGMVRVEIEQIG